MSMDRNMYSYREENYGGESKIKTMKYPLIFIWMGGVNINTSDAKNQNKSMKYHSVIIKIVVKANKY